MSFVRLLAFLCLTALTLSAAPDHPNIVFFVADDLGWNDVGYHGSDLRTPNIDALAAKGVMLDRFYAYPMCNPTRIALMSGRSSVTIAGERAERGLPRGSMPLDEHILPQVFSDAGYQTFMMGKWHIGREHVDYFPHRRGFDHFFGFLNQGIDYYSHITNGGLDFQRNGETVQDEGYSTELFTAEALQLIEARDKERPMLLYIAYNAVHSPLQAPPRYFDGFADIGNETRRVYAAMMAVMDDGIGAVLKTIDEQSIAENTIVVFISDNGGARAGDNSPLRGGKTQTFEGGIRAPAVIYQPRKIEGGRRSMQYFTVHDWLPTLAAAAGAPVHKDHKLDGKNLYPALVDNRLEPNSEFVLGHLGNFAVFRDEWKFVRNQGQDYLFRINDDPNETSDLKSSYPDIAAALAARIESYPGADAVASGGGRPGGPGARGRGGPGGRRGGPGGQRGGRGGRGGPQQIGIGEALTTDTQVDPFAEAARRD